MSNPVSPGSFDAWLAPERLWPVLNPKGSDTGTFDKWLAPERLWWVYAETTAAAPIEKDVAGTLSATGILGRQINKSLSGSLGLAGLGEGQLVGPTLSAEQVGQLIRLTWT